MPPVPIMGNKRLYSEQILSMMGVSSPSRIVLVEPGEWGRTLRVMFDSSHAVANVLESWVGLNDRALFDSLRGSKPSVDCIVRAAAHLYLSSRTYRGKPVYPEGVGWKTHGFDPEYRQPKVMGPNTHARGWSNPRPKLAEKIRLFAAWRGPPVVVVTGDAKNVLPRRAWVYIDPPYEGSTGYPHKLCRKEVLTLAQAWADVGAIVGISEAEPLCSALGWRAVQLQSSRQSRAFGAVKEWLTLWPGLKT